MTTMCSIGLNPKDPVVLQEVRILTSTLYRYRDVPETLQMISGL